MDSKNPKSLRDRAEATKNKIQKILDVSGSDHDEEVIKAIEGAVIQALLEERERCAIVAFKHCCDEDRDKAHKVADDIKRLRTALVTNLSSMR
ncbi:MAG: hypothetical protein COB59_04070 [Rhodospirillaceae bacterium]|nr:MAG: hypothetical protein COB59_04070 [Rhodospirillaceae bacterium]